MWKISGHDSSVLLAFVHSKDVVVVYDGGTSSQNWRASSIHYCTSCAQSFSDYPGVNSEIQKEESEQHRIENEQTHPPYFSGDAVDILQLFLLDLGQAENLKGACYHPDSLALGAGRRAVARPAVLRGAAPAAAALERHLACPRGQSAVREITLRILQQFVYSKYTNKCQTPLL